MRLLPQALAPRLFFGALMVTLAMVCAAILILYANTNSIIDRFLNDSIDSRRQTLTQQFEVRANQAMLSLEREIDGLLRDDRINDVQRSIDESVSDLPQLDAAFVFDRQNQLVASTSNRPAAPVSDAAATWTDNRLTVRREILLGSRQLGELQLDFSLAGLNQQVANFAARQQQTRLAWRQRATLWTIGVSLLAALICGAASWIAARRLVDPISAITRQAKRLQAGDYGEPLEVGRDDELGTLAHSFNAMRDQLRQTTISRDYVDNVLASMNDAIIVTSNEGLITHCNAATINLTGFTETALLGMTIDELIDDSDKAQFAKMTPGMQPRDAQMLTYSGETVPVAWTMSMIKTDDPLLAGRIYSAQNVSERKRSEERIRYLARMDPLTKVPNRMQFQHLLQRAIAKARRNGTVLALFYLDIDQFKDINDTFGHLAGDTTLETMARCMKEGLPEGATIGRLAGDEFAAFVDNLPLVDDMQESLRGTGRALLADIAEPFMVQTNEVYMTASLGIALYPDDADNVIDLLRNADAALYSAKQAGGNRLSFYDSAMNDAAVERLMLKSRLRRSFERDELLLNYQPKYDLRSGQIAGAEALVRWDLPDHGRIQPNDFIPLAEQTNLIIEIGEWVIERVCQDIADWHNRVGDCGRIAINLSLKQLRQRNFFNRINRIFQRYDIKPSDIEFEITETTLMEDIPRTVAVLDKLRAYGLELAIDDFGTGYSSLSALQKFPIKTLKIDRSFVTNVATDDNDAAIVSAIVDMSRNLRLDVVAEGVENEAQLKLLRSLKCDFGQGMLFGEPMDADDFAVRLSAQQDGTDQHRALFG
ncbi:MAG: EAL domain-containing protein [Pseudomonadota bacterium]